MRVEQNKKTKLMGNIFYYLQREKEKGNNGKIEEKEGKGGRC